MLKINEKQCSQCLFGKNRIVSATRKAEIVRNCKRTDTHFVCHKSPRGEEVVCGGFAAALPGVGNLLRIMQRLNGIEKVNVEASAKASESEKSND